MSFSARLVGRALVLSFGSEFLSKIAVLVTTTIAARAADPVSFGRFIGLTATTLLAAVCWDAGVVNLLTREVAAERISGQAATKDALSLRMKTLPLWAAVFALGVVILGGAISALTLIAFGGASLVFGAHSIVLANLRAALRFGSSGLCLAVGRWVTAGLSALALAPPWGLDALETLGLALLVGEAITLSLAGVALRKHWREGHGGGPGSRLRFRAALPFAANSVLVTAYNRFDVLILAALSSAHQLGLYAPASRFQDALYLLPTSIGVVGLPLISSALRRGGQPEMTRRLVARLMLIGLIASLPVAVLAFVFAPTILSVVLGPDYVAATNPVRLLVWSLPVAAVGAPLLAGLAGSDHAVDTTRVFAAGFCTAVVMHLSLDWWWGAMGGATASLTRDIAAVIVAVILCNRRGVLMGRHGLLTGRGPRPRDARGEAAT